MAYLDTTGLEIYHRKIVDLINNADEDLQDQIDDLTASDGEKVADVQVNGTSVVVSHAANIPVASSNALGVVKINSNYGVDLNQSDGQSLTIVKAGDDAIKAGSVETKAIVPANQHTSVFYGLAKAAGDVTQSLSENTIGTYTDVAKSKIREMIDAASAQDVEDLSSTVDRNFLDKAPVICETIEDAMVATFSDGMPGLPVKEVVFNIDPVQAGSGDPSTENVRDISGWTGINIERSGKNILNSTAENSLDYLYTVGYTIGSGGTVTITGQAYVGFIAMVKPGVTYTASITKPVSHSALLRIREYSKRPTSFLDDSFIVQSKNQSTSVGVNTVTFTPTEHTRFVLCAVYVDTAPETSFNITEWQIEQGASFTGYSVYNGNTYNVSFPSDAGEVYGGTLSVHQDGSGTLINDRWLMSLGTTFTIWTSRGSGSNKYFRPTNSSPSTLYNQDILCNVLPTRTITTNTEDIGIGLISGPIFAVRPDGADNMNVEDFKQWMQDESIEVLVHRATPLTYELTAAQVGQILILAGENNIWCNTGNVTVKYPVDTKAYIDGTNVSMIAQANVESGKYFHVGRKLYVATAAIAAGEAVVPGTNCTESTFADALNAILAQ